jgi:predicted N-formylglutamate amidohydrolase
MRYELIHEPFHAAVNGLIAAQQAKTDVPVTIVTIHTFTPIYNGKRRDVEIGFLHHDMPELSNAVQGVENSRAVYCTALNEPYNAADGVTYSLAKHADEKQLHSTMVEIRNDLVDTGEKARTVADHLAETLRQSIAQITSKAMQAAL